jgi:hypothetical protein
MDVGADGAGLSDHSPITACCPVPGRVSVPSRPIAIPAHAFDSAVFRHIRASHAETGWSDRAEGESPGAWLARISICIGDAVHDAVSAKKQRALRGLAGGSRDTALLQGDHHSIVKLSPCRNTRPAVQNTYKVRSACFHLQPEVLFSFTCTIDLSSTHLASVCCEIKRRWQHGGAGRKEQLK